MNKSFWKKTAIVIGSVIILWYIFLVFSVKHVETLSTFPGTKVNLQDYSGYVPGDIAFEDINISTKDGENINGLYVSGTGKTVYYFHGNGWPLEYFYNEIAYINDLWYSVMAFDYPGYWKSTGTPHKPKVDEFSQLFFETLQKQKNIKNEEVVVWWYSIGTAVATDFASKNDFDSLVLIAPFASRYDMGSKLFDLPIQQFFLKENSYISKQLVKKFTKPVLIIHGNKDIIVPFKQGKEVFNNYAGDKYFIELDKMWHNYIMDSYGLALKNIFSDYLKNGTLNWETNTLFLDGKKKRKLEFFASLDMKTDNSLFKFVSSKVSFNNKWYVPEDLEPIDSEFVYDTKTNGKMRKIANRALQDMAEAFKKDLGRNLTVVSSYRSYEYQRGIKLRGCPDNLCAKAGYSEHQSGLTVDIASASSQATWENTQNLQEIYIWLEKNAAEFGFHNTYQKGLEIDGYEIEPWHWRYVGKYFAQHLKENEITIAEYYNQNNK